MGEPAVLLSEHDNETGVLTLTFNRPQRKNAIDSSTWAGLHTALTAASQDPEVRALVLTGAGGEFCAGADLTSDRSEVHPLVRMRRINEVALLLHELPVPSV